MGKLLTALLLCAGLAACKKAKQPEQVPQPKMDEPQAAAPAVSTAPAVDQNPLNAPGNYLKSTVGQIDKAKAAKVLYEDAAKKSMQSLDLNDTGGN